jgi:predicted pyridoxine 5'-phosphate oxidase superfamily flavin-nucleotide-binding protein
MAKINPQIKRIIEHNPVAFSTSDKKGNPHVIAVAAKVVSLNQILVTDNYMFTTLKNLKNNQNIALAVWDKKWNGYRLKGKAKYFKSGKWHLFAKKLKENKGYPCKGAILVKISEIRKLC